MVVTIAIIVFFGVLLMILETFVPGWIAGILGGGCILTAMALVMTSEDLAAWNPWQRTAVACGIVAFSVLSVMVWLRYFAVKVWHRTFTLQSTIPSPGTGSAGMMGVQGVAITELRPLGRAEFSGQRREVRCQDGFAAAGTRLEVVGTEPGNLVVRTL